METRIRTLRPEDAASYLELRLRALREHPDAFATSYAEERERSAAEAAQRLAAGPERITLGAYEEHRLVGLATLTRPTRAKLRHRATLAAMYVAPEARGRGLSRALLERALDAAREWGVSDVALAVTVGNDAARSLYASVGFLPYGVEPRSLCVEGRFHDVELMNLHLPQAPVPGVSGHSAARAVDARTYYGYLRAARADLWAFLQAAPEEELDRPVIPGERFRSVKHLLLHIADVEDYWIHQVIRGRRPIAASAWPHDRLEPGSERFPLPWIHDYARAVEAATAEYLRSLDARELGRVVRQPPPQPSTPYTVESLLWHAWTHEVRHSAQVVLLARRLGHDPPWLDFLRFAPPAAPGDPASGV